MPKKGNAYLAGTVHVAKEVQTIQRFLLEPYMWQKRVEPNTGTVHVAKCSSFSMKSMIHKYFVKTQIKRLLRKKLFQPNCPMNRA